MNRKLLVLGLAVIVAGATIAAATPDTSAKADETTITLTVRELAVFGNDTLQLPGEQAFLAGHYLTRAGNVVAMHLQCTNNARYPVESLLLPVLCEGALVLPGRGNIFFESFGPALFPPPPPPPPGASPRRAATALRKFPPTSPNILGKFPPTSPNILGIVGGTGEFQDGRGQIIVHTNTYSRLTVLLDD